jgi:hypothetical protein
MRTLTKQEAEQFALIVLSGAPVPDTCRQSIEAKVAGMAGRESPLAQFYHDLLNRYDQEGKAVN